MAVHDTEDVQRLVLPGRRLLCEMLVLSQLLLGVGLWLSVELGTFLVYVLVVAAVSFPFVQGLTVPFFVFLTNRDWRMIFATELVLKKSFRVSWRRSIVWLWLATFMPVLGFFLCEESSGDGSDEVVSSLNKSSALAHDRRPVLALAPVAGILLVALVPLFFWTVHRLGVAPNMENIELSIFKAGSMSIEFAELTLLEKRREEEELEKLAEQRAEEEFFAGPRALDERGNPLPRQTEIKNVFLKPSDYRMQLHPHEHIDDAVLHRSSWSIWRANMKAVLSSKTLLWLYRVAAFWAFAWSVLLACFVVLLAWFPGSSSQRFFGVVFFLPLVEHALVRHAGRRYLREVFLDRARFLSVPRTRNLKGPGPRFVLVSGFVSFHVLVEGLRFLVVLHEAVLSPRATWGGDDTFVRMLLWMAVVNFVGRTDLFPYGTWFW